MILQPSDFNVKCGRDDLKMYIAETARELGGGYLTHLQTIWAVRLPGFKDNDQTKKTFISLVEEKCQR